MIINTAFADYVKKEAVIDHENKMIDKRLIENVLSIYLDEYRFVKKAVLIDQNRCDAYVKVGAYPYTAKKTFNYVTSTSISLLLSQVSYIFVAQLIKNNAFPELDGLSLRSFLQMRDNGDLLFTKNNFTFRKKIRINEEVKFTMELTARKRMGNFVCGKFNLCIPGKLKGDAMLLAGPLDKYIK
jgi:hypothetical protein